MRWRVGGRFRLLLGSGFVGFQVCCGLVEGMAEEPDYSSDRVHERDIFSVGGFPDVLARKGNSSRSPLSGMGTGVSPGPGDGECLGGLDLAGQSFPRVFSPVVSGDLDGLEADLALFRAPEGLGVDRPDIACLLGRTLSPQRGLFSNFPSSSFGLPVEGLSPRLGGGSKTLGLEGDLGSFSVGDLVVSETGQGPLSALGKGGGTVLGEAVSSCGQAAVALGGPDRCLEVDSPSAPKVGGSSKEGSRIKNGPRPIKDLKRRDKLVLGVDVSMKQAEDLSLTAVVGHARGKYFGRGFLRRWAAEQWKDLVDCVPEVRVMTKGWFAFILPCKEKVEAVLRRQWTMNGVPIILKSWTPFFDSKSEKIDKEPLWVKLPGFPMNLWNPTRFAEIGNFLGEFVCADLSYLETGKYAVAKILVKIDMRLGLSSEISVQGPDGDFIQALDYVGVPFRCLRCHAYGHLVASCPLPFRVRKPVIDDVPIGGAATSLAEVPEVVKVGGGEPVAGPVLSYIPEVPGVLSSSPLSAVMLPRVVDLGKRAPGESSAAGSGAVVRVQASSSLEGSGPSSAPASIRGDPPSYPPGMSYISSPAVSLFALSDAVGGVLSIGVPSLASLASHSSGAPCSLPGSDSVFSPSIVSTVPSTSSEGSGIRYALRSREISVEGSGGKGLPELSKRVVGRGRGRKSLLSKAQERAKVDLGMGTQSSIEWALRVVKAPAGSP